MKSNSNWTLKHDGWHKKNNGQVKGNADYFAKPIPPVRDGATGFPLGKDGRIDWNAAAEEIERKRAGNG